LRLAFHNESSRQPSLFERENLEQSADDFTRKEEVDRLYCEPGLLLGTSAFTASGWQGTFYPVGMKPFRHLSFYLGPSLGTAHTLQSLQGDSPTVMQLEQFLHRRL
jgi:hypothetical protein